MLILLRKNTIGATFKKWKDLLKILNVQKRQNLQFVWIAPQY